MAEVNWGAIDSKIRSYVNSAKFDKDHDAEISAKLAKNAEEAGSLLVDCIEGAISSSGLSGGAIAAIGNVSNGGAYDAGGIGRSKKYSVDISVDQNTRPSLYEAKYGSVIDMAMLLDWGYDAKAPVYGEWHGALAHSLVHRSPTHFFEIGVNRFNDSYGASYNAEATITSGRFS